MARAYGIGGDKGFELTQTQIVRAVQHAAVGITAPADEVVARLLGGGYIHDRAAEVLGDEGLGCLRTEVAEEDDERVAVGLLSLSYGGQHIGFVFYGLFDFVEWGGLTVGFVIGCDDRCAAFFCQRNYETVAAHGDDAAFDLRDVFHYANSPLSYKFGNYSLNVSVRRSRVNY